MSGITNSIAESIARRSAEARVASWLHERGLTRYDSIPVEQLPSIVVEFTQYVYADVMRMADHYQKIATDAVNCQMPAIIMHDPNKP